MKSFYYILIAALFFTSCGPLMNLETARTSGQGNQTLQVNVQGYYLGDTNDDVNGIIPFGEVKYNLGIASKFDIGISATSGGNGQLFTKYQFSGNQDSKVAMALGLKIGKQLNVNDKKGPFRIYVPLYFSVHPNEKYSFFLNPMYVNQMVSDDDNSTFLGFTVGSSIHFNDNEFLIGASYNNVQHQNANESDNLFCLGISLILRIRNAN